MSFKGISDSELLYLIRCDNYQAKVDLIERYKKRIYGMIKSFVLKNKLNYADFNDYYQSCFVTFLRCIELCDEEYNFLSYVQTAIENTLIKSLKEEKYYEKVLSLEKEELGLEPIDEINDSKSLYLTNEMYEFLDSKLSLLDKMIVKLKISGYNLVEISKLVGITKREIYRRFEKIRRIIEEKN